MVIIKLPLTTGAVWFL